MKYVTTTALIASIAFLSGCSSMKVTSELAGEFDFDSIQTYEWVKAPAKILEESDTTLNADLHELLNSELAERGWEQVFESDRADIHLIYYITLSEQEEYTTPPSSGEPRVTGGFTYNNDSGSWAANDQAPDINIYTVELGTLTVLIHDTITDEIVWRGSLQTKIDRGASPEKREQILRTVARKIIAKVP